ncbi:MAG TPA: endo-1,4-beta-xylanase [Bacteroidales bacterium]|nr:endo-1,4-beta-xylanase [Bacteroidales bacterium]
MKRLILSIISIAFFYSLSAQQDYIPLKQLFKDDFLIGVAVNERCFTGDNAKMVVDNYNTVTAENAMKPENVLYRPMRQFAPGQAGQPGQAAPSRPSGQPGQAAPAGQPQGMPFMQQGPLKLDTVGDLVFNWTSADRHADFARQNNLKMRGHTIVWHSQTPASFFTDKDGKELTKEQLYARLKDYMTAVMTRYKDITFCWDVVNEALSDTEGEIYRTSSPWYKICGKEFIPMAFRIARSVDPNAKLIYNDYNIVDPAKRERAYTLLKELKDAGVPIDGVGLQAHWSNEVTPEMIQASIDRFSSLGLEIQITELDLTVYTNYHGEGAKNQQKETKQFTEEVANLQAEKYKSYFEVLHKNADKITSVTFWGLHDGMTWLSGFPVRGRRDYPMIYDNELKPKKAYYSIKSVYQK